MKRLCAIFVALAGAGTLFGSAQLEPSGITTYKTMCNASAAVAIGDGLFVVADDEDKDPTLLRLYRTGQGGEPLDEHRIHPEILDLEKHEDKEVDIEAAAQVGDLVYWIGSHSATKHGDKAPNRRRLFATRLTVHGEKLKVEQVGKPYMKLIHDLDSDSDYKPFHLHEAGKKRPKDPGALSIEGLASTPDGKLLIGFRNPVVDGKALVSRLKNPGEVIAGQPAKFGKPILLDLGGLGIRSMERRGNEYIIVAGPYGEVGDFTLYRWSGVPTDPPKTIRGIKFGSLHPEALFFDAEGAYILSDDGKQPFDGKNCEMQRRFRGFRVGPLP